MHRPPPPDSVGKQNDRRDDGVEINVGRNVAALGGRTQKRMQPRANIGVEIAHDAPDGRAAPAFRDQLRAETDIVHRTLDEVMTRQLLQRPEKVGCMLGACEFGADFGAIALGNAGDDRFLLRKVAVEIAGAHAGFHTDLLHGRLMKAHARKTRFSRVEDFGAAILLELDTGAAHPLGTPLLQCGKRE